MQNYTQNADRHLYALMLQAADGYSVQPRHVKTEAGVCARNKA